MAKIKIALPLYLNGQIGGNNMFSIGEYVVYGNDGICQLVDVRKEKFPGNEDKMYYILKPAYSNNSMVYVPIENENLTKKMRRILTPEEINDLVKSIPDEKNIWIDDDRLRNDRYNSILKKGDRHELVMVIKTLYKHKIKQKKSGKKFHIADEKIMAAAEKMLHEEFALVLKIKPEEVVQYIISQVWD